MATAPGELSARFQFPEWEQALSQSGLPTHRQESMAITLRWYLSWAKGTWVAVNFDSARDFIAQVEMDKRPSPHRLEQWKEALRWFFYHSTTEKCWSGIWEISRTTAGPRAGRACARQ